MGVTILRATNATHRHTWRTALSSAWLGSNWCLVVGRIFRNESAPLVFHQSHRRPSFRWRYPFRRRRQWTWALSLHCPPLSSSSLSLSLMMTLLVHDEHTHRKGVWKLCLIYIKIFIHTRRYASWIQYFIYLNCVQFIY